MLKTQVTYLIDKMVVEEMRSVYEWENYESMSAFVEAALREKLAAIRRQRIQKQVSEAAIDPLFLEDVSKGFVEGLAHE